MAALRSRHRHGGRWWTIGVTAVVAVVFVVFFVASSGAVLTGSPSKFEAQSSDGNMVVDVANNSDWNCFAGHSTGFHAASGITVGAACNSGLVYSGALAKTDPAATTADDSWVNGQKMDNACALLANNKNPAQGRLHECRHVQRDGDQQAHVPLWSDDPSRAERERERERRAEPGGGHGCLPDHAHCGRPAAGVRLSERRHAAQSARADLDRRRASALGGNNGICVIKNDTMPCFGANILTPSTSSFEGGVNQAAIPAGSNAINFADLAIGEFAEFGVDLTTALGQSTDTCNTFAQTVWESRSSGSSFSSNPEDIWIENKTISNCGGIIIRKVTSPTPDVARARTSASATTSPARRIRSR